MKFSLCKHLKTASLILFLSGIVLFLNNSLNLLQTTFVEAAVVEEKTTQEECRRPSGRMEACTLQVITVEYTEPTTHKKQQASLRLDKKRLTAQVGSRIPIMYNKKSPLNVQHTSMRDFFRIPIACICYGLLIYFLLTTLCPRQPAH